MLTIEIDKDGGYIVVSEEGITTRTSIKLSDCVVSVPPPGYKKILSTCYNPKTGGIVYLIED